ncbi:CpaF family protein [Solirhodobacter olei]|uniref:CpaF family protein n=1 Tax=Solirhodobacter olei TaxID=2493082 RepID=UPI000FD7DCEB|nr:CpaF family protein [Solirhodobacter olei]
MTSVALKLETNLALQAERVASRVAGTPEPADPVHAASEGIDWLMRQEGVALSLSEQRQLLDLVLGLLESSAPASAVPAGRAAAAGGSTRSSRLIELSQTVTPAVLEALDFGALAAMDAREQREEIRRIVRAASVEQRLEINGRELVDLIDYIADDLLGYGPLESLLADDSIAEIMVNGAEEVYVERLGKIELTGLRFRDNAHVLNVAVRIVSEAGRRIDETQPLVDARLKDGSRVNVIVPPLAIDGPAITIRKFPEEEITLRDLVRRGTLSMQMASFLELVGKLRLNVVISGGTGAGKTTLLNALSQAIPRTERIITIEDAAELRLQQPHVVRLETRPPSIEGKGEVTVRTLLRNALRMRPDRIIIGEVRSEEIIELLQAMNTGHDGSMSTLHANTPREALTRMENMVAMSGVQLSTDFVRGQLKDAIQLIVQIARMQDGVRRVTSISELVGLEGDSVTMQELFAYRQETVSETKGVVGRFTFAGARPAFTRRAQEYGLVEALEQVLGMGA